MAPRSFARHRRSFTSRLKRFGPAAECTSPPLTSPPNRLRISRTQRVQWRGKSLQRKPYDPLHLARSTSVCDSGTSFNQKWTKRKQEGNGTGD